jgi:hypothetical protein
MSRGRERIAGAPAGRAFGGLAISATVFTLAAASGMARDLLPLLSAGALIAAVGLADDVFSLKPSTKLIAQISVASLLLYFGYRLHWTESAVGDAMLTLFWIVGITNAFNLLDNMDGLCSGIAIIVGVACCWDRRRTASAPRSSTRDCRCERRIPVFNFIRPDLPGRHGQPVPWREPATLTPSRRHRARDDRIARRSPCRSSCCSFRSSTRRS